ARDRGESVAFTAAYAGNLLRLARSLRKLVERQHVSDATIAEELEEFLERKAASLELAPNAKQERLKSYRTRIRAGVSGKKITIPLQDLADDLERKGQALARQVREREW